MLDLSPKLAQNFIKNVLFEPHYFELKLHLLHDMLPTIADSQALEILKAFDELLSRVKESGNRYNIWTSNVGVISILLLIVKIAQEIGKKYTKFNVLMTKVIQDVVMQAKAYC